MNGTVVFFIIIMIVFLVIDGLIVAAIVIESNKLKTCETKQSPFCPSVLCNYTSDQSIAATSCGGFAYRFIDGDETNTDEKNIECSS